MPTSLSLRSRTLYFWLAWGLWLLGVATGGAASHVLGVIMAPERFPLAGPGIGTHALARVVFSLALFTNLVLPIGAVLRSSHRLSVGATVFLAGSLLVDLAVAAVVPQFACLPGYWVWTASIATMTFALIAVPDDGVRMTSPRRPRVRPARTAPEVGVVPGIVWVWLGCFAILLAVSLVDVSRPTTIVVRTPDAAPPRALTGYVTDEAHALSPAFVERVSATLAQFEKDTSNQIAVAVYPAAPSDRIEEFSIRLADVSRLGRKGLDNGAILVVFPSAGAARFEVGYGLEGVLNDGKVGQILAKNLAPVWQSGTPEAAIEGTLAAVFDAVRDAYAGGRMPGKLAVFRRQASIEVPKAARAAVPVLAGFDEGTRLLVAFFAALIATGFWDGFRQAVQLARIIVRAARNLVAGRALSAGSKSLHLDSMVDSVKILVFFGVLIAVGAGIVVVAGGGGFGGGGASVRW